MKAMSFAGGLLLVLCQYGQADESIVVRAIRLSVDESGSGLLTVDARPEGELDDPSEVGDLLAESPFKSASRVSELEDGRLRVTYDFSTDVSPVDLIPAFVAKGRDSLLRLMEIDADAGVLVLDPGEKRRTQLPLLRRVRPPFDLELECIGHAEGILQLTSAPGSYLLGASIHGQNSPESGTPAGTVVVFERAHPREAIKTLTKVLHAKPDRDAYAFRLKGDAIRNSAMLSVSYFGELPLAIQKIRITAHFPPSFGMALAARGQHVVVTRVVEGSAGAAADVRKGDVLISVGDEESRDVQTALSLLAQCRIGVPVELTLRRYGQEKRIAVTPK